MNLDDLQTRATVATVGWLKPTSPVGSPSKAFELHKRLFELVASAGESGRRETPARIRSRLIDEINASSRMLIGAALAVLESLLDSKCAFTYEGTGDDGEDALVRIFVDEVPNTVSMLGVLRRSSSLRSLKDGQQIHVVQHQLQEYGIAMGNLQLNWPPPVELSKKERVRLELDLARYNAKLASIRRRIDANALQWLSQSAVSGSDLSSDWSGDWPLLPAIDQNTLNEELELAARWYESIGTSMHQPLPVDESGPAELKARWKQAWALYGDCGEAVSVLAVWIRCLAVADESQRCEMCFRHLGPGARRFCSCHYREGKQRLPSRQIHVSAFYRQVLDEFLAENRTPSDRYEHLSRRRRLGAFSRTFVSPAMMSVRNAISVSSVANLDTAAYEEHARAFGLPDQLVQPAATLAALLRLLFPIIGSVLEADVQEHFISLLKTASAPFARSAPGVQEDPALRRKQQMEAMRELSWETFFKTWYGRSTSDTLASMRQVCRGIDPDHPVVRGYASVGKIALDMAHLRAWTQVDQCFDSFAYLSLAKVENLRRGSAASTGGPLSFTEIGAQLGASHEAVRKTFEYGGALSDPHRPGRRERVLPQGLKRLSEYLGL